ncbi:MAG: winged helix DNA-binding protein, partial [Roseburia sp.]|nr:winged helix DNA-binding protein [Roseburia sp.]
MKGLEEKGLIERSVNRADRRNTYVELTEHGKRVMKECKSDLDEVMLAVFAKMGPEDIRRLIGYLDEIYLIAKEEIELRIKKKERKQEDE